MNVQCSAVDLLPICIIIIIIVVTTTVVVTIISLIIITMITTITITILRSREVAADPLADEEPDVWYSTSKLFMDHINEVGIVIFFTTIIITQF